MPRKRVAHVVYSYLPVTQNWIYTQLRCNRLYNHTVISLTEEECCQFPWEERYVAFLRQKLLSRLSLLLARYWLKQPDCFFRSTIAAVCPDVIHGHFSTESWRILAAAQHADIPLITTFYGLDVDKLPRRRFWKKRYPELFAYGSRFLVEGPFMGKRLVAIGCPKEKIQVVSLGVDRELYNRQYKKKPLQKDAAIQVLFVGLGREKKGSVDAATIFINAVKENALLTLHIVGDGSYKKVIKRMFAAAGMLSKVTFYGNLSFSAYREVLLDSDVLLVPSCYAADGDCEGGAPVVCIEAQVAGIPIVGTKHCDIPYVVVQGETGFLSKEHDTTAMTTDLLRLAGDEKLRLTMGESGKRHAAQQHDIYSQVEKVAGIYNAVLENKLGAADG